jgi:hypothetical protein
MILPSLHGICSHSSLTLAETFMVATLLGQMVQRFFISLDDIACHR